MDEPTTPPTTLPTTSPPRLYQLTLTRRQAEVVRNACELLACELLGRLGTGQLSHVAWWAGPKCASPDVGGDDESVENFHCLEASLRDLEPLSSGFEIPGAYHSIGSPKVDESAKVAWDLYKVVAHRLLWDGLSNPSGALASQPTAISEREALATFEAT
jgi:hypothetical protein